MKKLTAALISAVMMIVLSIASFAGVTLENRQAADTVDIANDAEGAGSEIEFLYGDGVRVFDTAGLLNDEEKASLEDKLGNVESDTGVTAAVFTSYGNSGAADTEDFADMLYCYGSLGKGDDKDGAILVIDMDAREAYIYTSGTTTRYITDSMINYIFDELEGGLYSCLSDGDYAGACSIFADGMTEAYQEGIGSDQYNYDTQTGAKDPYAARKHGLNLIEILGAAIASAVIGIIPVSNTKRKYAMKAEKAQAERFNLSYRADAVYAFSKAAAAAPLISTRTTAIPIPRPQPTNGGGGHGHGGGISSGSIGRSGSFHGGGGRKF